jgi:hypothetical protein
MSDMGQLMELMPILNVLIIPALVFVVRIDRRMGQLDVLNAVSDRRIETLEKDYRVMRDKMAQIEYSTRHV